MRYVFDDGGRAAAGYKGTTGDCAVRAIAIATGIPYQQAYEAINDAAKCERQKKRGKSNARTGVFKATFKKYMASIGWKWTPLMAIGSGCKVHMKDGELPQGTLILNLSKHYAACIDGVIHDTHQDDRGGTRCVYGYWSK